MHSHPSLSQTSHRPWPLPDSPWVGRQSWPDLLFMHWRIPAAALRPLIPPRLDIQEYDGSAWIGVVPFRMEGAMLRGLPNIPGISAFPELNVRTYVARGDRPGIWFFSLDASKAFAVWGARAFLDLPYYRATMGVTRVEDGWIEYRSRRLARRAGAGARAGSEVWSRASTEAGPSAEAGTDALFSARYRPTSDVYQAEAGSLDHWLTERYCLYSAHLDGSLSRLEIHHRQWPLQQAEAVIEENTMLSSLGLDVSGPPLLHFSRNQQVIAWAPQRLTDNEK